MPSTSSFSSLAATIRALDSLEQPDAWDDAASAGMRDGGPVRPAPETTEGSISTAGAAAAAAEAEAAARAAR